MDWDGYGDPNVGDEFENEECPLGWVTDNTDCDDVDILTYPGAPELPDDGISQDCDGDDLIMCDETGVFVAKTGDDANPGTMALPVLTINAAADLALLEGKSVFIAQGEYTESVSTGVSLFGGYESAGWTRNIEVNVTTIITLTSRAVSINCAASIAVQGLSINGGSGGSFSYGVKKLSGTATLTRNIIYGGSGNNSYGVDNVDGAITLVNNSIHGGNECGLCRGVTIHQNCAVTLMGNTIEGGSSDFLSCGVENSGVAMLVNNDIDAGSATGGESGYSMGIYNNPNGMATMIGNTIGGGSSINESYGVESFAPLVLQNNLIDGGSEGDLSIGVYSWDSTATLVNNTIDGGSGSDKSKGVYNGYGMVTMATNIVDGGLGGNYSKGVYNYHGTMMLTNNFLYGGSGSNSSYGVHCESSTVTLANNTIDGGAGGNHSYGVRNYKSAATLANNTIGGGTGGTDSYGVRNSGTATLVNNTIDGGSGEENSYSVYNYHQNEEISGTAMLANNDMWGADLDCMIWYYDYSNGFDACQANIIAEVNACAWTGCVEASGNISDDPLFVDPVGGDYHLQDTSQCIDAGIDPSAYIDPALVEFDFEGDARPFGAGWDIGADEWTPASSGQ